MSLLDPLHKTLSSLTPEKRKMVQKGIIGLFILAFGIAALVIVQSGKDRKAGKETKIEKKKITLDEGLLQRSFVAESQKREQEMAREMEELKKQLEEMKKDGESGAALPMQPQEQSAPAVESSGELPPAPGGISAKTLDGTAAMTPPPPPSAKDTGWKAPPPPPPPAKFAAKQGEKEEQSVYMGGIATISIPKEQPKDTDDKKDGEKIYLPPSFMEATLLSGIRAPTMGGAKSTPRPAFLRIRDLAVLPNDLKADLKGCFVIAEGQGDLSDERVHLRIINLTCLAKNGKSIIDQGVKGVVIDSDGQLGLGGTVVTRMGALLGRSVMAGLFGGMGDAINSAATTQSISPLGTTQTIDSGDIFKAGVGKGVSTGFNKLMDFYLEMADQTKPVIEAGATKTVTVAITEGTELNIKKDYCTGGMECGWRELL